MTQRAVITGMGLVSCLGSDLDEVSAALRAGKSGIAALPERLELGFSSPLTGQLRGYDGGAHLSRKQKKSMSEPALYATVAAQAAIADAGIEPDALRAADVGVIIGNDSTVGPASRIPERVRGQGYCGALGSGTIFQVMGSTVSMNLSTLLGTRGANWSVAAACASGAHAVGQAMMLVKSGMQRLVIAGGAQELCWEAMAPFDALNAFSRRDGSPQQASRPFDSTRDGLVPSGGAAILIVESEQSARARSARIYGELAGYAFSANGAHLSLPSVEGPIRCMRDALARAGLAPEQVSYINAHATSTPAGDLAEGRALLEVFGRDGPPVSSTKSMTGHECWMSGASELVYSALMIRDGFIAPNINLDRLDPELEGLAVVAETVQRAPRAVLSNAFGFGGTNATVILKAV